MKYNAIELEILKTKGKRALQEYRKSKRVPLGRMPNRVIETRKHKRKYKPNFDEE